MINKYFFDDIIYAVTRFVIISLLGCFYSVCATANIQMPTPAVQMQQFDYFRGEWQCQGKQLKSERSPEHNYEAKFTITTDMDGFWVKVKYEEIASQKHPFAIKNIELWSYDAGSKTFTNQWRNNMGMSGSMSSSGWSSEEWTWSGKLPSPKGMMPFKGTLKKVSENQFTVSPTMQVAEGNWITISELACKK